MSRRLLTTSTRVDAPIDEVFRFFSDPSNLATLTPPWLRFRVRTDEPVEMGAGTRIRYRLRVRGVPMGWTAGITAWDPPRRFVDEQVRGPFRLWIHEHDFVDLDGRTECRDRLSFQAPGGAWLSGKLVEPDLKRIFDLGSARSPSRPDRRPRHRSD